MDLPSDGAPSPPPLTPLRPGREPRRATRSDRGARSRRAVHSSVPLATEELGILTINCNRSIHSTFVAAMELAESLDVRAVVFVEAGYLQRNGLPSRERWSVATSSEGEAEYDAQGAPAVSSRPVIYVHASIASRVVELHAFRSDRQVWVKLKAPAHLPSASDFYLGGFYGIVENSVNRAAEAARVLADHIAALLHYSLLGVAASAGDFNARVGLALGPHAVPGEVGPNGSVLVAAVRENSLSAVNLEQGCRGEPWTWTRGDAFSTLDLILASPEARLHLVADSAIVHDGVELFSDHCAVSARFRIPRDRAWRSARAPPPRYPSMALQVTRLQAEGVGQVRGASRDARVH